MLDSLGLVSKQVGILFALMVVGFLCNRRRLLNAVAIKGITELLVLIVTPCVIVHSFIQQKSPCPSWATSAGRLRCPSSRMWSAR